MTLNDLWDWLIQQGVMKPRFKDKLDDEDMPLQKMKASKKVDPQMLLKYQQTPQAISPFSYQSPVQRGIGENYQRRGTMPKVRDVGLDSLLYDLEHLDKQRQF